METSPLKLEVALDAGPEADARELDRLSRQLRDEIESLDVDSVELRRGGQAPPGTMAGEEITIGSLIISLASAGVFTALIETLKGWALRKEGRTIKIETQIGDRSIKLEYSPTAASQEELTRFVESITHVLKAEGGPK
jgi:hypothetical protein